MNSVLNNKLEELDIPERSKGIYRDHILNNMSARDVSEKYHISIEMVKNISDNVAYAIIKEGSL